MKESEECTGVAANMPHPHCQLIVSHFTPADSEGQTMVFEQLRLLRPFLDSIGEVPVCAICQTSDPFSDGRLLGFCEEKQPSPMDK